MIDTHCHLNFQAFDDDLPQVVERAHAAGVEKIIIPGAKIDSSQKAISIAHKYQNFYATVGIHPHHAMEYSQLLDNPVGINKLITELSELAQNEKVVAIGEVGLDNYQYKNYPPVSPENRKYQLKLLALQMEVAVENNLPVILHCRNAYEEIINYLRGLPPAILEKITGVCHCFEGEEQHLKSFLDLGFFIGFDGNCTYKANDRLRNLIHSTPLDRLLLETDAPYLTPVPHRGKRNEPSYLPLIARAVAITKSVEVATVGKQTTDNAVGLFHL